MFALIYRQGVNKVKKKGSILIVWRLGKTDAPKCESHSYNISMGPGKVMFGEAFFRGDYKA